MLAELPIARLLLLAIVAYALVALAACAMSERMIFLPPPPTYRETPELLRLPTPGGERIAALYLADPAARYTVLFSHGNAEDLGGVRPFLAYLRALGFGALGYDYRGYGLSEGRPSERASYEDIEAAYEYLVREAGVPGERIIAYGRSVGSGPAVELATRRPLAGLVLESPFLTAFRVVTRIPLLPFDRFRNIDKIDRVRCPVLVMHGMADEIVPFSHGRALFAAASEPKRALWVEGAGHNDFMLVAGERHGQALREFAALLDAGR